MKTNIKSKLIKLIVKHYFKNLSIKDLNIDLLKTNFQKYLDKYLKIKVKILKLELVKEFLYIEIFYTINKKMRIIAVHVLLKNNKIFQNEYIKNPKWEEKASLTRGKLKNQ